MTAQGGFVWGSIEIGQGDVFVCLCHCLKNEWLRAQLLSGAGFSTGSGKLQLSKGAVRRARQGLKRNAGYG